MIVRHICNKTGPTSIILPRLIFDFFVFDNTVRFHFQLVVKFVISFLSVGGAFQNGRHFQPKSHVNQPICKYMVSRCTENDSFELYLTLLIIFKSYNSIRKSKMAAKFKMAAISPTIEFLY